MSTKLRVEDGVSSVSVQGTEYKATNGIVTVSDHHAAELKLNHGLLTPEQHQARIDENTRVRLAQQREIAAMEEADRKARIEDAKKLLLAAGHKVT